MINLNEVREKKEELKNKQIEETKDELFAAGRRFCMKQESGVATQEDFLQCLREMGEAREKRKQIMDK